MNVMLSLTNKNPQNSCSSGDQRIFNWKKHLSLLQFRGNKTLTSQGKLIEPKMERYGQIGHDCDWVQCSIQKVGFLCLHVPKTDHLLVIKWHLFCASRICVRATDEKFWLRTPAIISE